MREFIIRGMAAVLAVVSLPSLAGCSTERDDSHGPHAHADAVKQSFARIDRDGAEIIALDTKAAEALSRIKNEGSYHARKELLRTLGQYIEMRGRVLEKEKEGLQSLESEVKKVEAKDSHKQPASDEPPCEPPLPWRLIQDDGDLMEEFGSRPAEVSKSKSAARKGAVSAKLGHACRERPV